MRECSINPQVDVKHFGADGEAVESLCSEQESTEQVVFSIKECGSMTFYFQDSSQERWELEALRQEALSSLVKVRDTKSHVLNIVEMHHLGKAEFLSFFPRRWKAGGVGIQANQKALDEEGQLAGKEESRVQCEGAGGGRLVEAVMEVKPRIGAKMPREGVGVQEVN